MHSRPNADLLALRPAIATETSAPGTVAHFLHNTLRPILKLQNPLLLALVTDFVSAHHIRISPTDHHQLAELLTRNTKLRYNIIGLISGHFTSEEYGFYQQNRAEINRRLLELALHRVLHQADEVAQAGA